MLLLSIQTAVWNEFRILFSAPWKAVILSIGLLAGLVGKAQRISNPFEVGFAVSLELLIVMFKWRGLVLV